MNWLILQSFRHLTYVTAQSPILLSLYLHHSSFANPSFASPTSQLIPQPFRWFTYVTVHSPTLLSLLLRLTIFTYVTWWAAHDVKNGWDSRGTVVTFRAELILLSFRHFTYVTAHSSTLPLLHLTTAHSPTLPSLYLRHSSFFNPSVASPDHSSFSNLSGTLPTSQLILQPFHCFTYIIGTSPTSPGELPMPLWWCLIYPWWFCNLQWLRPAGLYERCKLALKLNWLKTPGLEWFCCVADKTAGWCRCGNTMSSLVIAGFT